MTPLQRYIEEKLQRKKILLMTHTIIGYPSLEANWKMIQYMQEVGVDLVELQMPFSEPTADGPLFIKANQYAIDRGIVWKDYFDFMQKVTASVDFSVLMMGYYNPVFKIGHQAFCQKVQQAGGTGFILPDLPIEEFDDLWEESEQRQLSPVLLCTPTNSEKRLAEIMSKASGLVYCVARKGVTGSKTSVDENVIRFIDRCKKLTSVPLALGFGISQKEDLQQLQGKVEVAIVGSALLKTWEEKNESDYREHLENLVAGCV